MRLYIHAGTFKTASSAIQNSLYSRREALLKHHILYPEAGISKKMSEEVGFRHSRIVYHYGKSDWDNIVANLKKSLFHHNPHTVILSSEAWSTPGASETLFSLIEHLQEFDVDKIDIAFVVRNVFDYSISHYREFVRRWGFKYDYLEYVEKRLDYFDYNALFSPFLENNKVTVKFIPYSKSCVDAVLKDMNAAPTGFWNKPEKKKVNKSLSALDIEIQRKFNILHGGKGYVAPQATELLARIGLKPTGEKILESTPPVLLSDSLPICIKKSLPS
ncbi:hypothetical protein OPS25_06765 [Alteromonas ponticola]|uniref:Sulfotransferase domain-containing protein n=1 Tax=Alteromonas aquimaris TaxID=2998417 RepID=A0ABT3P5Z5_9ALTE|nr:hypothetical protein [Alteromonas aquimaris]MCW8108193.1 hypothetical protein [Alteromonas aquimaris]